MTLADAEPRPDSKPQLPSGWRRVRLGEVIREAQLGFASGKRDPGGVVQLRMNNVTNRGRLDWSSTLRVPADTEIIETYRLEPGDVLFNNTNSTDLVGKTALFEGHTEPVVFSNHFTRLRVTPDELSPAFLAFWLQEQWQRRVFENICNRWIGQSAVQRDKLLSLEIPLPPVEEQKRIAAILNEQVAAVERARTAAQAQLEAAKALPAAYLRAIFNSPDAQRWPVKRLGEVCEFLDSRRIPVNDTERARRIAGKKESELFPYYGANGQVGWIDDYLFDEPLILLAEDGGNFGSKDKPIAYAVSGRYWVNNHAHVLKPRAEIDFDYCLHAIRIRPDVGDLVSGSTRAKLNQEVASTIPIPLPPLSEQRRIATTLSEQTAAAEKTRKALEEQLDAINALPAALLRRAFSGEL